MTLPLFHFHFCFPSPASNLTPTQAPKKDRLFLPRDPFVHIRTKNPPKKRHSNGGARCCSSCGSGRSPASGAAPARSRRSWTRPAGTSYLCAAFLAFHGLSLALLFAASVAAAASPSPRPCRRPPPSRSPRPCSSGCAPTGAQRGGCDGSAAFDLSKEPQYGVTRAKCANVEGGGVLRPLRWCCQNVVTACLLAAALPSGKFILCA